jgi:hypothetical protein
MQNQQHVTPVPPQRGAAAWFAWFLRWSLVLVLVSDLVGAPLHQHHHDSGIDALALTTAGAHDHLTAFAQDADHPEIFGHSTLAVRPSGDNSTAIASISTLDDAAPYLANLRALLSIVAPESAERSLALPQWHSPFVPAHRSLPPAGRAPPLHA